VEQPKEHHWDVFEHSIQTVAAVEAILKEGPWDFAGEEILAAVPSFPDLDGYFRQEVAHGSDRRVMLKLAALLHDNAKPQTKTLDEKKNRTRFLGHPEIGAEVAGAILERLRFSNREIKLLKTMVKYHLRPGQMSQEGMPTKRAIYRYFRDTEGVGIDTLYLSLADFMASRGPGMDLADWREHTSMIGYVLARRFEGEQRQPPRLMTGHDLMELGVKQGPELGRLLEQVNEAQGAGEISTREEALTLANKLLGRMEAN
jgi:poly(A) polymerase